MIPCFFSISTSVYSDAYGPFAKDDELVPNKLKRLSLELGGIYGNLDVSSKSTSTYNGNLDWLVNNNFQGWYLANTLPFSDKKTGNIKSPIINISYKLSEKTYFDFGFTSIELPVSNFNRTIANYLFYSNSGSSSGRLNELNGLYQSTLEIYQVIYGIFRMETK